MGYRVVDPEEIEPAPDRPCELRRLSEAAGLDRMAINRYRAAPGEQIPLAYHYHDEQEEAFYVCSGTMHVETPEGTIEVPAGGLFAVDPGEPQRAYNPENEDEDLTVIAVGAPPVDGDAHAYEPAEDGT
ncbi:cupin domain-containing protein [Halopenitus salinus]|uniref:Cupin domain-containing protein n=1 Tax=Halopenitus salinus TaxID=1198295 RepID=A0ABD5UY23_9EURY